MEYHVFGDSKGWLLVKPEPRGENESLPEYLLVIVTELNRNGRDYFRVLEGSLMNRTYSVTHGYLKKGRPPYKGPAQLVFNRQSERLIYSGKSISAITDSYNEIPIGTHPIQIPDSPHKLGAAYLGQSGYALSWFFLGRGRAVPNINDRYLHTGRVSAGCVTVAPNEWTALYQYLILCRSGDNQNVGSITVHRG